MDEAKPPQFQGHATHLAEPLVSPRTKIGGAPLGLSLDRWPSCARCAAKLQFVLQLNLCSPVRLSSRFEWAYLFVCPHYENYGDDPRRMCETWVANEGTNAVVLSEPGELCESLPESSLASWPER